MKNQSSRGPPQPSPHVEGLSTKKGEGTLINQRDELNDIYRRTRGPGLCSPEDFKFKQQTTEEEGKWNIASKRGRIREEIHNGDPSNLSGSAAISPQDKDPMCNLAGSPAAGAIIQLSKNQDPPHNHRLGSAGQAPGRNPPPSSTPLQRKGSPRRSPTCNIL